MSLRLVLLLGTSSAAALGPAPLPVQLMWRLTLVEHHGADGLDVDASFGAYYFDWSGDLVSTRQDNAVGFASWRNANHSDLRMCS